MSDPHLNIFHAYRGPSRSEDVALRQLEDNLTRALMIVLDRAKASPDVSVDLLTALGVCGSARSTEYQCYLQVSEPGDSWPAQNRRRLLILHGGPTVNVTASDSTALSGRIDGLVTSPEFLLGIESKIGNSIDEGQITRHCQLLGIERDQVIDRTWSQLARASAKIRDQSVRAGITGFVLKQFEEYLRMNGFGGFTADHFSYFALPQSSRDELVKEGIRRVLREHVEPIVGVLGSDWNVRVLNIRAGTPDTGVVIEPGRQGQDPHITLGIDPSGLSILANIELDRAYRRFMRTWKTDPLPLIEWLRSLGRERVSNPTSVPWRLGIKRRVPLGRPRHFHYWQAVDLALSSMVDWPDPLMMDSLDRLFAQPDGEAVPQIFFHRSYPAALVLQHDDVSGWLSSDTKRMEPFFHWLA